MDINWLSGVVRKAISDAPHNYLRYRGVYFGDEGLPADVVADVVDDLDDIFGQGVLCNVDYGSSFTSDDYAVSLTALARISRTVPASSFAFDYLFQDLVGEVEASHASTASAEKEIERQKGFVSAPQMSANNALNNVASLCGRILVPHTREAEIVSSVLVASGQLASLTARLRKACDEISAQSKGFPNIVLLKVSDNSLEDNTAFYETSEERLLM